MSGFSNESRRFNSLFCLAVHEVQSSDPTKEVKLHTPFTPANVRIHGTMYRRVLSSAESNAVQYLVVDPAGRRDASSAHRLDADTVARLEPLILKGNPLMEHVKSLRPAARCRGAEDVVLTLDWDEGKDEIAALLASDSSRPATPRAVVFPIHKSGETSIFASFE
jgi:hypothetical protein